MATAAAPRPMSAEEKKVIFASSLGTVFEWYDFYLYGSLAAIIAKQFFSGLDAGSAFIFALLAFAAGFIVRPFGAIFFGRLGDMIGRKYTFLVTILIMGLSTFIVGILPTYASIGVAAPVILIVLRLLQGFSASISSQFSDLGSNTLTLEAVTESRESAPAPTTTPATKVAAPAPRAKSTLPFFHGVLTKDKLLCMETRRERQQLQSR